MNKYYINIDENFSFKPSCLEDFNFNSDSEVNIDFISDFKSTKIIREFISLLSDKLNIDKVWKARLILVADELNNNAIEYGSLNWEINRFKILISFDSDSKNIVICFEIEDTGNWPSSKKAWDMLELKEEKIKNWIYNWTRGRGLFIIINKIVDDLYFKDSINWWLIVWIKKELKIS